MIRVQRSMVGKRVLLTFGEAKLAGCLKVWKVVRWSGMQASSNYAKDVLQDTVDEIIVLKNNYY